jgi:hypothetical protein
MRVLAIASPRPGRYGARFAEVVIGALRRVGADVTAIPLSEDVRDHPGHDA